jgi:hypothetical protein
MQNSVSASHLTMANLKARGWNHRLVGRFLGSPDSYSNPGFKAGRPARLYWAERVHHVEMGRPEFDVERERSREVASRRGTRATQAAKSARCGAVDRVVASADDLRQLARVCLPYCSRVRRRSRTLACTAIFAWYDEVIGGST